MGVLAELKRERNLKKRGTWRKRLCLLPRVVFNPDTGMNKIIYPFTFYWEQFVIGHYGYEGAWHAATRKY